MLMRIPKANEIKQLFRSTVPENWGGAVFYPIGTDSTDFWGSQKWDILKQYLEIPELSSVINYKARAFSNMRLTVVSKETGQPTSDNQPLVKILRNPNWFQSQLEFIRQDKLFREVYGNEIMYLLRPIGMGTNYKGWFTLNPAIIKVTTDKSNPYWTYQDVPPKTKYSYTWNNQVYDLPREDIIHLNDNNIDTDEKNYLTGYSKIDLLKAPLQNIRAAYEARNVLIENRGALGILSNASRDGMGAAAPMLPKDKEQLQKDFQRYGVTKKQWQVIITNLALDWKQMSIDTEKLKLFEEVEADFMKICDMFGMNSVLFSNEKGSTFANLEHGKKQLYQDTIIPEAQEWIFALNKAFETENKSWIIVATYDHLPVFGEDKKQRGQALTLTVNALSKALADKAIDVVEYQRELEKFGITEKPQ